VLPARLYEIIRRESRATLESWDDDGPALEELSIAQVDCIAGPRGVQRAIDAASRSDCPVVPELLRPID
jgi:hypothetical protein